MLDAGKDAHDDAISSVTMHDLHERVLVDGDPADAGFDLYVKRPIPTWAKKMDKPFAVVTIDGNLARGKAGDWLCLDDEGAGYPCKASIFENSYARYFPPGIDDA